MSELKGSDTFLRRVLLANGIFSAATGVVCLFASARVADYVFVKDFSVFGMGGTGLTLSLGAGLLIFAVWVINTACRTHINTKQAKTISMLDGEWVLISVLLIGIFPEYFSTLGIEIVLMVAMCVFLLGIGQIRGLSYQRQTA